MKHIRAAGMSLMLAWWAVTAPAGDVAGSGSVSNGVTAHDALSRLLAVRAGMPRETVLNTLGLTRAGRVEAGKDAAGGDRQTQVYAIQPGDLELSLIFWKDGEPPAKWLLQEVAIRSCHALTGTAFTISSTRLVITPTPGDTPPRPAYDAKLDSIVLPEVVFRLANMRDIVSFFSDVSREYDPDKKGVNVVLQHGGGLKSVTVSLRDISLRRAMELTADAAGATISVEDQAVVLRGKHDVPEEKPDPQLPDPF